MTETLTKRKRPNIVIVCNDDHASWVLPTYGNREMQTPAIDYLAATGTVMEQAFTPCPVCSPGRASLLTGRMPSQHGVHDYISGSPESMGRNWMKDEITLPMLLSGVGYRTAMIGKWHLGNDMEPQSRFDRWYALSGDYPIPHRGPYRYSDDGVEVWESADKSTHLTDKAIEFLREQDGESPFFLYVAYVATHHPWNGHCERLVSHYRGSSFIDVPDDEPYPFGVQALESTFKTRDNPPEALAQYYAGVAEVDEGVGRIVDTLETSGFADNTIVVFTSDHGLCCGHHGIWGKGNGTLPLNVVEEAIRVPLIIRDQSRIKEGQRRTEFVDHLDLFQTLVELADISLPGDRADAYPGRSFRKLLAGIESDIQWREVQFCEYGELRMARTEHHKLVLRFPDGPHELFDLVRDPRETFSFYNDPGYQSTVDDLTDRINQYFDTYEDPDKSGLRVRDLPKHNDTEAWRTDSITASVR